MDTFINFLQKSKEALNNLKYYETIHLVLGNESCDLDSTVSALCLAYLIHSQNIVHPHYLAIPIMNVEAKYFHLRTEIQFLLNMYNIDSKLLIFKDQINYSELLETNKLKTSLVDHHVLSNVDKILEKTVVEIFDHRPINDVDICNSGTIEKTQIKTVGSCATLVGQEIIDSKLTILFDELCHLLYATIVYDTIGLDTNCGKTFEEDLVVAEHLENILKPTISRKELFNLLWKIHNDTSSLTTKDLLYRDLKVVRGIPIPGLPMLVEDYLQRDNVEEAIASFATEYNSLSVVLIGIDASQEVKRDIAVFSADSVFKNTFITILKEKGSELLLTENQLDNENIICFRQGNIKLTRKFILPLVDEAARTIEENAEKECTQET